MKVRQLHEPLTDIEGEPMNKRVDMDDVAELLLRYGVPQSALGECARVIESKVDPDAVRREPWTGAKVITAALQYTDKDTSFDKRAERMALAMRLLAAPAGDAIEIEKTEIKEIKELIAKVFPHPIVAFRMNELFKAAEDAARAPPAPQLAAAAA